MDALIPAETIERKIFLIRGQKVMLDVDLADLYGVETRALIQAVKRNTDRFPTDFMFQLTQEEATRLRSQTVISNVGPRRRPSRSRSQTASLGRGGRRYLPYAFTEQGVAMLSSVLRSKRAARVNIAVMRAFVKLREMIASHKSLAHKLDALEKKYDSQFKAVFDAIRQLMSPSQLKQGRIGFRVKEGGVRYSIAAPRKLRNG